MLPIINSRAPGIYIADTDVIITEGPLPESAYLGVLQQTSVVTVTEILENANSPIIRGRTKYGWVSIIDTKTGICWLRLEEEKKRGKSGNKNEMLNRSFEKESILQVSRRGIFISN